MDIKKAIDIINFETIPKSKHEEMEAYKAYFKMFGVNMQNQDGAYKNLYDIFEEASANISKEVEK